MRGQGRSEDSKGLHHPRGVLGGRAHEQIDVAGRARKSVCGERMGAHDDEVDPARVERVGHVELVVVELRRGHRRLITRPGAWSREYVGSGCPLIAQASRVRR